MENNYEFASCETVAAACPALREVIEIDQENELWKDDATWILTSSFVILTMQSGFGLLEIGASSAGNEVNTMLKNVGDVLFGGLAFYLCGCGIAFGSPSNSFMGLGDFVPTGRVIEVSDDDNSGVVDTGVMYSQYLFQLSFAATSATIVSGCIAMRMKLAAYCIFSFFAVIAYSFVAHWVFADEGWLRARGFLDFAGASAVHLLGAINGLIAILFVGPRKGRFDKNKSENEKNNFAESSPTSMLFGLFMLWWGWIGFNCGSTFGITDKKWMVAARAGVNTINASVGGGIVAIIYSKYKSKGRFVRPVDVVNGILGALVSSSAFCTTVVPYDSLIVGAIAGLLANLTNELLASQKVRLDDPVGAIGVHGTGAIVGLLAVALLADPDLPGSDLVWVGLFRHGGSWELLQIQLAGIAAVIGWSVLTMTPLFFLLGCLLDCGNGHGLLELRPRRGLRHDYHKIDAILHGCSEYDPYTSKDLIVNEISKALAKHERNRQRRLAPMMRTLDPNHNSNLRMLSRKSMVVFTDLKKILETDLSNHHTENDNGNSDDDNNDDYDNNDNNNYDTDDDNDNDNDNDDNTDEENHHHNNGGDDDDLENSSSNNKSNRDATGLTLRMSYIGDNHSHNDDDDGTTATAATTRDTATPTTWLHMN